MTFIPALAMLITAVVFAFIIWVIYRKFRISMDPRLENVTQMLGGLNCGACGFASCENFSEALFRGENALCPLIKSEEMSNIYKILGRHDVGENTKKALVLCKARREDKTFYAAYQGVQTCRGARDYSSYQGCSYGCLGFGDCVGVCPASAIEIIACLAVIDIDKCIGCGLCVKSCPQNIITIINRESDFLPVVSCSSKDKMVYVKSVCRVGCIGCGVCVKLGPPGGFLIAENIARVNPEKVKDTTLQLWEKAAEKCPMNTIEIKSLKNTLLNKK